MKADDEVGKVDEALVWPDGSERFSVAPVVEPEPSPEWATVVFRAPKRTERGWAADVGRRSGCGAGVSPDVALRPYGGS